MDFRGWTDLQDAVRACRLAIEKDWRGHEVFFINGDETTLSIPTLEAIVHVYPGVPLRKPLDGFASVLDTSKAERIMGWVHRDPTGQERLTANPMELSAPTWGLHQHHMSLCGPCCLRPD